MLDMGFIQPVRKIVAALHPRRQSALFSATMPSEVSGLAQSFLKDPVRVEVAPPGHHRRSRRAARRAGRDRRQAQAACRAGLRPRGQAGHRLRPHQARRRPGDAEPRQGRHRRRGDPRQQGAERPPARAQRLPQRPCAGAGRHRHRGARHRRARRQPHHQLRPARRAGELRAPHRPHRAQRRRRHRHHPLRPGRDQEAPRRREGDPPDAARARCPARTGRPRRVPPAGRRARRRSPLRAKPAQGKPAPGNPQRAERARSRRPRRTQRAA